MRYFAFFTLCFWLCAQPIAGPAADAPSTGPFRIGVLTASWGPPPAVQGMVEGLASLGHKENQDFVVGVRFTQGDISALDGAVRRFVENGVDMIVTTGEAEAVAAKTAAPDHPVVFTGVGDPIGTGLIESYGRPGGHVTGITDLDLELGGKRLQLFSEFLPSLRRVMFPYNSDNEQQVYQAAQYRAAARILGLSLIQLPLSSMAEAEQKLSEVDPASIDGFLIPRDVDWNIPGFALKFATEKRIPVMASSTYYLADGAVAGFGSNGEESGRQAARLIDKIIQGMSPAEIPVEVDEYVELAIDLGTAEALGLVVPPTVLFQANRIDRR